MIAIAENDKGKDSQKATTGAYQYRIAQAVPTQIEKQQIQVNSSASSLVP